MSVARDADPTFMGSANDVAVRDENYDDGYTNKCLDISEFSVAATNRELVNLENAAVNIDNSSDVIIGPVTQFNVNGNVTIYQNKDGLPIGIEQNDDDVIPNCNGNLKAQPTTDKSQKQEQEEVTYSSRRKYTLKFYICVIIVMFLLLATTIILIVVFNTNTKNLPVGENTWINSSFGTVTLIPRKNWNGREPKKTIPMKTPVDFVVIKHTGGGICRDFIECAKKLQTIQSTDFTDGKNDIYCSFLVGGDGNVYEGRGWDSKPEYLDNAIDIVMLGNFAIDEFTVPMITATHALLEYGVKQKKLTKDYRLVNHNQTTNILSPGQYVVREVVTWPHYDSRNYLGVPLLVFLRTFTSENLIYVEFLEGWENENRIKEKLKSFIKYLKDNYPKRKKDIGRICICLLLSSCAMVLYVSISTRTNELTDVPFHDRHLGNYNVYSINDWGRKIVTHILDNPLPVGLVIVSHTSTETCVTFQKCAEMLKVLQIYQTTTLGYEDICYNFFIGITGDIYVGRGWDTRNCYTNKLSIAISFIGNFNRRQATKEMRESFILLLQQGVELSKLPDNYLIVGYNQTELSNSPGENVYEFIKDLPNFSDIDLRQKYKNQCSIYEVRVGYDGLWSYPIKL